MQHRIDNIIMILYNGKFNCLEIISTHVNDQKKDFIDTLSNIDRDSDYIKRQFIIDKVMWYLSQPNFTICKII